jgi:hypothetical protein
MVQIKLFILGEGNCKYLYFWIAFFFQLFGPWETYLRMVLCPYKYYNYLYQLIAGNIQS